MAFWACLQCTSYFIYENMFFTLLQKPKHETKILYYSKCQIFLIMSYHTVTTKTCKMEDSFNIFEKPLLFVCEKIHFRAFKLLPN